MNLKPGKFYGDPMQETDAYYFSARGENESLGGYLSRTTFNEVAAALKLPTLEEHTRHVRRVVGHLSGWQEKLDVCVCGASWPCPQAGRECHD